MNKMFVIRYLFVNQEIYVARFCRGPLFVPTLRFLGDTYRFASKPMDPKRKSVVFTSSLKATLRQASNLVGPDIILFIFGLNRIPIFRYSFVKQEMYLNCIGVQLSFRSCGFR